MVKAIIKYLLVIVTLVARTITPLILVGNYVKKEPEMKFKKPIITTYSLADFEDIIVAASCGSRAFKCDCYQNCLNFYDPKE